MEKEKKNEFHLPEYYENRELSWLKFDARVLNEAKDKSIPLLERLKFVSITSSNLDEFFMVRVASLKDMVHADYRKRDIAGMTASEQLDRINTATRKLVESQYNTYNRSLVPLMAANGIHIIEKYEELTAEQAQKSEKYNPCFRERHVESSRPGELLCADTFFRGDSEGDREGLSAGNRGYLWLLCLWIPPHGEEAGVRRGAAA